MASESGRILLSDAEERAAPLLWPHMKKKAQDIDRIKLTRQFRQPGKKPWGSGSIDQQYAGRVIGHFTAYADIKKSFPEAKPLCQTSLTSGLHVDLRCPGCLCLGLHHFTGFQIPMAIALRKRAVKRT